MAGRTERLEYQNLIEFVRPSEGDQQKKSSTASELLRSSISGEEARQFYEELCSTETAESTSTISFSKSQSDRNRHYAHEGKKSSYRRHGQENKQEDQKCVQKETCSDSAACGKKTQQVQEKDVTKPLVRNSGDTFSSGTSNKNCTEKCGRGKSKKRKSSMVCSETREKKVNMRVVQHRHSELLRCAQNGDVEAVMNLIELGVDVNFQDVYGWTASMSAGYEGHVSVLKCLVSSGADMGLQNSQGQTVLSLAQRKNHTAVIRFIQSLQNPSLCFNAPGPSKSQKSSFYCEVCKTEFTDSDQKDHLRSTVHLFNTGKKPKDDRFLIPSSNVGFRLMLKSGWDPHGGLGPSGEGQKFPVKTLLKQDRKGLGTDIKDKAKVTHFKPYDPSAIERNGATFLNQRTANVRTLSRRAQRAKERRDRQWEIEMRRHLS